MSSLIDTIRKTKESISNISIEKRADVIDLLMVLTARLVDNITSLNDIPKSFTDTIQPSIKAQLIAAEKRIETATDDILGAAEKISSALNHVSEPAKKEIQIQLNRIFEASGFQDLVSQHLNEITIQMDDMSIDIEQLQSCLEGMHDCNTPKTVLRVKSKDKRSDAHLLNGPSTSF